MGMCISKQREEDRLREREEMIAREHAMAERREAEAQGRMHFRERTGRFTEVWECDKCGPHAPREKCEECSIWKCTQHNFPYRDAYSGCCDSCGG